MQEFDGLLAAIRTLGGNLHRRFIRYFTDNVGIMYAINNNYSRVLEMRNRVRVLQELLAHHRAAIRADHIAGKDNVVADGINRLDVGDAY